MCYALGHWQRNLWMRYENWIASSKGILVAFVALRRAAAGGVFISNHFPRDVGGHRDASDCRSLLSASSGMVAWGGGLLDLDPAALFGPLESIQG